MIANDETSGLAAAIVTADEARPASSSRAYAGTGAFWNATTRLLDGFKLLACPRPGSTSTPCPAPAARSPSATCTYVSSW